jgi:antitoxin VapB
MYIHPTYDMSTLTSRVFFNGNSQAVRIPAEFRLDTDRVAITRTPEGDLVLHPIRRTRGAALLSSLEGFADDFLATLEADRAEQPPSQDREQL